MIPLFLLGFITFTTITIFLFYLYMTSQFSYWEKRKVFYIKPIPFFGNLLPAFTGQKPMSVLLQDFYNSTMDDYMGFFSLGRPILLLRSPKLIKNVLQKDFAYFSDRNVVTPDDDGVTSNMMFFKKGPLWKIIRSKISPVFTSGKLKSMFHLITKEAEHMNDYVAKLCNRPNTEVKEIAIRYSTNVIAVCAFGVEAQCFKDDNAEFRNISRNINKFTLTNAIRQIGCFLLPALIKTFHITFFDNKILGRLEQIFSEVLSIRRQSNLNTKNDLIDLLLEQMKQEETPLTDDILMSQALVFFTAGFETVGSTLSFFIYEMSVNQSIQDKLRIEIKNIITMNNGLTYEGINEMKYLDMCICETLRKYPVLPFLDRECNSAYKVPGTDFVIEKGQAVFIPMFGLHYDEKYFPNPQKFDPSRFEDKTTINRDGLYYMPFGEGPRICIGNRFASMTVKIGLVSLLSKYKVHKSSKTPVPIELETKSLTIQSTVGIPVELEAI